MLHSARLPLVLFFLMVLAGSGRAAEDSAFWTAVKAGDRDAVAEFAGAGQDVDEPAADGSTPLLWAAYNFDIEMARVLVDAGADADIPNHYGVTPLLQAGRTGHAEMVRILVEAGADTELAHPGGETPLMAAALSGNVPAVRLLVDHGADVNAVDSFQNQTALMWAAAEGHLAVVDVLLDAGAAPNLQARVTTLTERQNADHPTGGFNALMWAARNGDEAVVRRLAEGGADLDLKNGDGASATMIAIYNDRFDMAATLIELGADPNDGSLYTAVEMRRSTTDQFAFDGSRLRPDHENALTSLDLIEMLLARGADPHRWFEGQFHSTSMPNGDRFANTPFFRAANSADVEALEAFLPYIGDIDQVLVVPESPDAGEPEEAPAGGRGRGGNPNAGRTAAMAAMTGGRAPAMTGGPGYIRAGEAPYREPGSRKPEDAFRLLLDAGADPNATDPDGVPLLHQAARAGNLDIIRALGDAGVDFEQTDGDGLTALDLAEGRRPEGGEAVDDAPGGRGARGRGPDPEVAALLRERMGLPPAEVPALPPAEIPASPANDASETAAEDGQ